MKSHFRTVVDALLYYSWWCKLGNGLKFELKKIRIVSAHGFLFLILGNVLHTRLLIPVDAYCEVEGGMVVDQVLHQVHVVGEGYAWYFRAFIGFGSFTVLCLIERASK